jgi:hypothetical protein
MEEQAAGVAVNLLAPALMLEAPPQVHGSAVFSRDRTCRNEIRRWWVPEPKRWVAWLMLNPSLAGVTRGDQTAGRVTHFSRSWGYDGWIGVNLYPLICSKPAQMWRWAKWDENGPDWYARDDIHHNAEHIERAGRMAALRIVAFGAEPIRRDDAWLEECIEAFGQPADAEGADERLYCLGTNSAGQPLHPMARGKMRVPDDTKPILWRE